MSLADSVGGSSDGNGNANNSGNSGDNSNSANPAVSGSGNSGGENGANGSGDSGDAGLGEDNGGVQESSNEPWYYDHEMPGAGDRPDWLLPKFKTAAEQAKSFAEAEKRLGAFKGAPEEYDLTIPEAPEGFEFHPDDPLLRTFLDDAKKNNVSQEYVTSLLKTYVDMTMANRPDPHKELEKLGVNAKHDIQILAQWGSNNLTPEEFVTFKNMMVTAESVRLLEKLRAINTAPATAPKNPNTPRETEAEVRQMIHDPRFGTDESYRNMVREKLKQFGS